MLSIVRQLNHVQQTEVTLSNQNEQSAHIVFNCLMIEAPTEAEITQSSHLHSRHCRAIVEPS